jgi:uncharacterized Zn finger protein
MLSHADGSPERVRICHSRFAASSVEHHFDPVTDRSTLPSPPWDEDDIRARVGVRTFERGALYEAAGALFDLRRDRAEWTARCEGSGEEVYRLRALRAGPGAIELACSCPIGESGACKHGAALLITAAQAPERFVVREPLEALCLRAGGGALAEAIERVAKRSPSHEDAVRAALRDALGEPPERDVSCPKQVVGALFRDGGPVREASPALIAGLEVELDRGAARLDEGRTVEGIEILRAVCCGVMARARRIEDPDGALRALVHRALAAVGRSLRRCEPDAIGRAACLEALFDPWRFDAENGTVFGTLAGAILTAHGTSGDRATLAARARAASEGLEAWARRVFDGARLDLDGDSLDDDAFVARCRDAKRHREWLVRLIHRGRIQDAQRACAEMGEGALLEALAASVTAGHAHAAERLVEALVAARTAGPRALSWWRARLEDRGDERAWDARAAQVIAAPDREGWRALRALAGDRWTARREALLDALSRRSRLAHIEALVDEGLLERAKDAARGLAPDAPCAARITLAEQLAQQAPLEGAELLRAQADALLARRGRANYREAARVLRRARELYEGAGQRGRWVCYAESLRALARELPALREELAAALARPTALPLTSPEHASPANDNAVADPTPRSLRVSAS